MFDETKVSVLTSMASMNNVDDSWKQFEADSSVWAETCIAMQIQKKDISMLRHLYDKFSDDTYPELDLRYAIELFMKAIENKQDNIKDVIASSCDMYDFGYQIIKSKPNNSLTLAGRVSINDMGLNDEAEFILAEGSEEAYQIIKALEKTAAGLSANSDTRFNGIAPRLNAVLSMDDMNIRGKQLVYASEFVEGNIQKLTQYMLDRNGGMIEYINYKSALEFKQNMGSNEEPVYIAVEGGGSATSKSMFTTRDESDFVMNVFNANIYADAEVSTEQTDYATMEIVSGTDLETAKHIAEANGFTEVCKIPKASNRDNTYYYVMFNKETGDFLEAASAKDDDICYGGCRFLVVRNVKDVDHTLVGNSKPFYENVDRSQEYNGPILCDISYQGYTPMIKAYNKLPKGNITDINFADYPISGIVSLPYPQLSDYYQFATVGRRLPVGFREFFYLFEDEALAIAACINVFRAKELVDKYVPAEFQQYFTAVTSDPYKILSDAANLDIKDASVACSAFKMAAAYVNMPEDEVMRYVEQIIENYKQRSANLEQMVEQGKFVQTAQLSRAQKSAKYCDTAHWMYDALDKYMCHIVDSNYPEPDVSELPSGAIEWMRTYGPSAYEMYSDWGLFAAMRDNWYASQQE